MTRTKLKFYQQVQEIIKTFPPSIDKSEIETSVLAQLLNEEVANKQCVTVQIYLRTKLREARVKGTDQCFGQIETLCNTYSEDDNYPTQVRSTK